MNIEQLKSMSNIEINKLCATKIMEFKYQKVMDFIIIELENGGATKWNPAEDMNDSMKLVDKLQNTKPFDTDARWLNFSFEQMKYGDIAYNAFITDEETNKTHDGNGKTAPLAISYACLLAVMDS